MLRSALLAAASVLAFAPSAYAQDADEPTELSEIVVTVQKREQQLIDVPAAVTAYGGEFLDRIGVSDFEELSYFTPGFEVQNQSPNNPAFVVRGITSDSGTSVTENRVSIFQDGVSISRARGAYVELFDVERVEVAKGPQSTLFGRGALIGAVNIIQNKADLAEHDFGVRVGLGNLDYKVVEGFVNLPVSDTFAVRAAGRYRDRNGFVDNLLGGEDFNSLNVSAARLSARWAPTERFTADLIFNYSENDTAGTSFKSRTFLPTEPNTAGADPRFGRVLGNLDPNSGAALSSAPGFKNDRELGLERDVQDLTALASYEINDALTLNSVTAFRTFDSSEVFDPDGFSLPLIVFAEDATSEQFSQELRLNYDAGGRVRGFVGVNYFDEEGSQSVPGQFDERVAAAFNLAAPATGFRLVAPNAPTLDAIVAGLNAPGSLLRPVAGLLKPAHRETFANFGETQSVDVYGDVSFDLTDKIELTAGVRYTRDEKTSGYQATLDNGGSVLAAVGRGLRPGTAVGLLFQPTARVSRDFEDDGAAWRLLGRYKPTEDVSVYASYARGRQPKVLSPVGPTLTVVAGAPVFGPVTFNELPAETVDSYEVGFKGRFLDGRLGFETATYYYKYENFQSSRVEGPRTVPFNGGEADAPGFEGQADWRPTDWAQVFATYAYNEARFQNGAIAGNRLRSNPDHSASVGGRFTHTSSLGELNFTPTYAWQSEVFFDVFNDEVRGLDLVQDERQDSYGLLNARLTFTPANRENLEFGLFVDNALDEEFIIDAGNTGDGFGIPTFIAGEPRTYGFTLSVRR